MGGKQQESQEMGKGMHEQIEFAVLVHKLRVACAISGTLFWIMGYGGKTVHIHTFI